MCVLYYLRLRQYYLRRRKPWDLKYHILVSIKATDQPDRMTFVIATAVFKLIKKQFIKRKLKKCLNKTLT